MQRSSLVLSSWTTYLLDSCPLSGLLQGTPTSHCEWLGMEGHPLSLQRHGGCGAVQVAVPAIWVSHLLSMGAAMLAAAVVQATARGRQADGQAAQEPALRRPPGIFLQPWHDSHGGVMLGHSGEAGLHRHYAP